MSISVNLCDSCEAYFGAAYNNLITITNNVFVFVHVHLLRNFKAKYVNSETNILYFTNFVMAQVYEGVTNK